MWRKVLRWVPLLLCLAWMIVIWRFSCAPGEESSEMSGGVEELLNGILQETGVPFRFDSHTVRKTAHFTEFAVLGCLAVLAMFSLSMYHPYWYAIPVPVLTAAVDETIQRFVPGRAGTVGDVLLDSAGGMFGIFSVFLIWWVVQYFRRFRAEKKAIPSNVSK